MKIYPRLVFRLRRFEAYNHSVVEELIQFRYRNIPIFVKFVLISISYFQYNKLTQKYLNSFLEYEINLLKAFLPEEPLITPSPSH